MATPDERAYEVISIKLQLMAPRIARQLADALDSEQLLADLLDLDRTRAKAKAVERQLARAQGLTEQPGYSFDYPQLIEQYEQVRGVLAQVRHTPRDLLANEPRRST